MSDTVNETKTRTIPPTPRHMRTVALLLGCFIAYRVLGVWANVVSPIQGAWIRKYIWASILPSRAKEWATLHDVVYHKSVLEVLWPVLAIDAAVVLGLYIFAYRIDYRKIRELRRGIRIAGPRLYMKPKEFQAAIWKQ